MTNRAAIAILAIFAFFIIGFVFAEFKAVIFFTIAGAMIFVASISIVALAVLCILLWKSIHKKQQPTTACNGILIHNFTKSDEIANPLWSTRKVIDTLYVIAFVIHISICLYVANYGYFVDISDLERQVVSFYKWLGLEWSDKLSNVLVFSLLSAFILNIIRRFFEGLILGWLRISIETVRDLMLWIARCSLWICFALLVIGVWGSNDSSDFEKALVLRGYSSALDSNHFDWWSNVAGVALFSFIFGAIINVVVDLFASIVSFLSFFVRRK